MLWMYKISFPNKTCFLVVISKISIYLVTSLITVRFLKFLIAKQIWLIIVCNVKQDIQKLLNKTFAWLSRIIIVPKFTNFVIETWKKVQTSIKIFGKILYDISSLGDFNNNYYCGDKIINNNEECDDGNLIPFDGCFNCEFSCPLNCQNC